MEANFFRFLATELGNKLIGRRIDTIFGPTPGVWTLKIQNSGEPLHLLFRPAKTAGHLFLSKVKPANPQDAPAMAMWFRKRLRNRLVIAWHVSWPTLQIAFELSPRSEPQSGKYLVIDILHGMSFKNDLDDTFFCQPEWPAIEDVTDDPQIWKEYLQISPPLRKEISSLDTNKAHQLYLTLATGDIHKFYLSKIGGLETPPLLWPPHNEYDEFDSALAVANAFGERTLFPLLEIEEERPTQLILKRARKKIKRNLLKLEEEEARLTRFAEEKIKAEALQSELYKLKSLQGYDEVTVMHPVHGAMKVALNPFLSPTENMQRYFKLASKAERGFTHISRRRNELLSQLKELDEKGIFPQQAKSHEVQQGFPSSTLPKRYKGLAVSLFRSSDGVTLIRGKNKKANHEILSRAASPFDYWFHIEDGPSSHIILKRDHPGQTIPEQTLIEAAILCGLKSYRKDDGKADVMYALVKDIRKIKGLAHGQVVVDKKIGSLRVKLDAALETTLSIATTSV